MDNDDVTVGRILKRREVLALFGTVGAGFLAGCAAPRFGGPGGGAAATPSFTIPAGCIVSPQMTEGPYFVDEKLNRSDIRSDPSDGSVRDGALLNLAIRVSQVQASGCAALPGAIVDIWHCDVNGVYSDVSDQGFNSKGKKFLRGYQTTDSSGLVKFTTVFPGWYSGRAVHVHFKVRSGNHEFTSQLFFEESVIAKVFANAPYAAKGKADTPNARDGIYQGGGNALIAKMSEDGKAWNGTLEIGMAL